MRPPSRSPWRDFLEVSPHPPWVLVAFAVLVLAGAVTLWFDAQEAEGLLGATMLLQMFAASSGFSGPASRGQYDAILTSGRSWPGIMTGHWAASTVLGAAAWGLLGLSQLVFGAGGRPLAFRTAPLVAFFTVSTLAWAIGTRLPRFSAGVLWAGLVTGLIVSRDLFARWAPVLLDDAVEVPAVAGIAAFTAVPFLLIRKSPPQAVVLLGIVGVVVATAMLAARHLARRDYPLVEEE